MLKSKKILSLKGILLAKRLLRTGKAAKGIKWDKVFGKEFEKEPLFQKAATTKYAYDANNRVTSITYPDAKVVGLTYNNGGNIATITYPNGLIATYTYDDFNRQAVPSLLKNNPGTEIAGESRSTNAVTGVALFGAAMTNFTLAYNNRGKITLVTRPSSTTSDYTL